MTIELDHKRFPFEGAQEVFRQLDDVGDGTGTKNAVEDYSDLGAGATAFTINPPDNGRIDLTRMIVAIQDGAGMRADRYASLASALTNGVDVGWIDNSGNMVRSFLDNNPITTNAGWGRLCYDVDVKTWGAGDELLLVRWTFAAAGIHLSLDSRNAGYRFGVVLNDNFTGVTDQRFTVEGYQINY